MFLTSFGKFQQMISDNISKAYNILTLVDNEELMIDLGTDNIVRRNHANNEELMIDLGTDNIVRRNHANNEELMIDLGTVNIVRRNYPMP